MEGYLSEKVTFKQLAVPANLLTAPTTGARIQVAKGFRVTVVCNMGESTSGITDFTMKQHTASTGGTTKVLATSNPYFEKVDTDTSFTKVAVSDASNIVPTTLAADPGIFIFEVLAEDLDRENGFSYFSLDAAESTGLGNDKIMAAIYILNDVRNVPAYNITV